MSLYNDRPGIWSHICLLADLAVIILEEEKESMMHRIFDLVPRRKRSSFSKKSKIYEPQNPNSDTADQSEKTKKKDPPNPNSNTAESEKTKKKEPSKSPNSDTTESEITKKKDPSNPNSDTTESEKSKKKNKSLNPNCNSSSSSLKRKRCTAVKEKSKGGVKKANLLPRRTITETPEWVLGVIRRMNAHNNATLIFEKTLTTTDVNKGQARLLIPFKQLLKNDLLTHEESLAIRSDGVETNLFNQRSEKWGLCLKIWAMGKDNYALKKGWNDVVKANNLKAEENISLWSFRCEGVLSFVLGTHTH